MFQLSDTEVEELSRCKIFTLNKGRGSNIKYVPYAFTEQGIYMLMTVLKGDLAVTQSKMVIRTIKEMKHFIQNNSHIFAELDNIKKHLLESDWGFITNPQNGEVKALSVSVPWLDVLTPQGNW